MTSGLLYAIANAVRTRGLAAPARLLLEAHRPLRPLMAEATVVLSPVLRPLLGGRYADTLSLLGREEHYDELIDALDDAEHR